MKTIKPLILCSLLLVAFVTSCEKKDEPAPKQSPVVNTTWAHSSGSNTFWLEFTSNTDYLEYMGDADGNPASTGVHYGTYTYSDSKITFSKPNHMEFDYGTINGSILTITYTTGKQVTYKKK